MTTPLPTHIRVVIVGGGIIGTSIAYHLSELGLTDVAVVERGELTCGTTWHAAGLVPQLRTSYVMTQLCRYAAELYDSLGDLVGQPTGFKRNGTVYLANTEERFTELKRVASLGKCFDVEVEVRTPAQLRELWPLLNIDDLAGGIYAPHDGQTNPVDTTMALAKGARCRGVKFFQGIAVSGFQIKDGRVKGVETDHGAISCEFVVNCGGIWSRQLGKMAGVNIPVYAAEHMYITTKEIPDLPRDLPVLRDAGGYFYAKEDAGKLLVGSFEPEAKPLQISSLPERFEFGELPEDWDHFSLPMAHAMHRIPVLETAEIRHFMNGPESFTPDNRYILGEAPELRNYFVATGFNSQGIMCGAGAGKAMAEWISEGVPTMDLAEVDLGRFSGFQSNRRYLRDRTVESMGLLYKTHYPHRQVETARPIRRSALHAQLKSMGACFGELSGWERPNWFAPEGVEPVYQYSFGRQNWFDYSAAEHLAIRENVGVLDLGGFSKFLVEGPDARTALQRIAANNVDVEEGKIVYTAFLNRHGGIEADLTITRLGEERFLVITSAAAQTRDFHWIRRNLLDGEQVMLNDITSAYSVLAIMGPKSRELISRLSDADLSNEAFPFGTMQEIEFGYAKAMAFRITFVGELGWEVFVPTEFASALYDEVMQSGKNCGVKPVGFHALDSLRLEKGYRHWGDDLSPDYTPLEAGIGFAVAFNKGCDFIGREALEKQKAAGVQRRMVHFKLKDPEPLLLGNEPVFHKGRRVGRTTSGTYGHTIGAAVALAYVEQPQSVIEEMIEDDGFEIEFANERFEAMASIQAFYDPKNERPRM